MSSEWRIYTKLSIEDMVEKFKSLPKDYPSVFGFYAENKLLLYAENEFPSRAHYIDDPKLVYTEHTPEEEYLKGFYKEEFGFRPVSTICVEPNSYVEHFNGIAFLFFIQQFLSDIDHFLIHGSTCSGPEGIYPDDYEPPDIYRFKG